MKKSNKPIAKRIFIVICATFLVFLGACKKNNYYEETYDNPLKNVDVGGSNMLNLKDEQNQLTLENEKIRIIINSQTGGIVEIVNKESKVYLVKNRTNAMPIKIDKAFKSKTNYSKFEKGIVSNTDLLKEISLTWTFDDNLIVKANVSLAKNEDNIKMNLELLNNVLNDTVISIEYPIVENIKTLYKPTNDFFVSPFAMGYLFANPTNTFNSRDSVGITKGMGLYPQGWNYPLQFSAYYSSGIGGFYWQTTDGQDGVKSFTFTGYGEDGLRMSIHHYLDDIKNGNTAFNYDIVIANLTVGNWHEAANKYRNWAENQDWVNEKGPLKDREDIDKKLFEETSLVNFGYMHAINWPDKTKIYDLITDSIDGKIMNIYINAPKSYLDRIEQKNDLKIAFEFADFYRVNSAPQYYKDNAITNAKGEYEIFTYGSISNYFQNPTSERWLDEVLARELSHYTANKVNGFYNDVGIAAVHPLQSYNILQDSGTRVNLVNAHMNQAKLTKELAIEKGIYSTGHELMIEQMIPYVDFFQARANGGLLGWMEHDRIRDLIKSMQAIQIPLFDFVYHEYGALRFDGYLVPMDVLGTAYYHTVAYTVLNGGIPEFNFEFFPTTSSLPNMTQIDLRMLNYIDYLGKIRQGYGKDYLVYGKMVKPPIVGTGNSTYNYFNPNHNDQNFLRGKTTIADIVVSAFESNGKTALFFANITDSDIDLKFVLNALRDYGINSGTINYTDSGVKLTEIKNGKANIDLTIKAKTVISICF